MTMAYQISYNDEMPISVKKWRNQDAARIETFRTEHEALTRARELIDAGDHHSVVICDSSGNTLAGVRLQLKLGFSAELRLRKGQFRQPDFGGWEARKGRPYS